MDSLTTSAQTRPAQAPNLPNIRVEVRRQRVELVAAGLPDIPTSTWARDAAHRLVGHGIRPSRDQVAAAVAAAYVELAVSDFASSHRCRFEGLARVSDAADRDAVRCAVVDAAGRTLGKLVPRALAGHRDSVPYVDTVFRSQFVEAWRALRQGEGAKSREDWFGRSKQRVALFDDDADLLWLADKITRQLYRAPFRADLERAHPFPLAAWADELDLESVDTVRRLVDEVLDRIAIHCPEDFAMNIASSLQLVHERLAVDADRAPGRDR